MSWRKPRGLATQLGVLLLGGLGCCVFVIGGFGIVGDGSKLAQRGQHATGVVLEEHVMVATTNSRREVLVRFSTSDGVYHQFWESGGARVGSEVEVLYDPYDPRNATIKSPLELKIAGIAGAAIGFLVFGGLLLMLGASVYDSLATRASKRSS